MGQPPTMVSMPDIDALLSAEGTRVEWKQNVADVAGIVRTLSAFANDYGKQGKGWIICGIEEQRNEHGFSVASKVGLEAARYRELRNKVVDWCHRYVKPAIDPEISTVPVPEHPEDSQCDNRRAEPASLCAEGCGRSCRQCLCAP